MIARPVNVYEPMVINLDGADGNTIVLMAIAKRMCQRLRIKDFSSEMMNGSYMEALELFEKTLGDYVRLETKNNEIIEHFERLDRVKNFQRDLAQSASLFNF
jgi:hypothetical protein